MQTFTIAAEIIANLAAQHIRKHLETFEAGYIAEHVCSPAIRSMATDNARIELVPETAEVKQNADGSLYVRFVGLVWSDRLLILSKRIGVVFRRRLH